jgi:hypothetical protein
VGAKGLWGMVLLALALSGCEQPKLTEADCTSIGSRIEGAWLADANEAMSVAQTEEFRRYAKDEGGRLTARWMIECRKLIGTEVAPAEVRCLKKASRIEEVERCQSR